MTDDIEAADDVYPTETELESIEKWPIGSSADITALLDVVRAMWWCRENGVVRSAENIWELHTWGWSGNEDIIEALQKNLIFWGVAWVSSRRGGHYEFEVPEWKP